MPLHGGCGVGVGAGQGFPFESKEEPVPQELSAGVVTLKPVDPR